MAEMKRIIAPTDFSEASLNAINFVLGAFKQFELELHLLNVYTPAPISGRFMSSTGSIDLLNPIMEESSASNLKELKSHLLKSYDTSGLSIVTHSSFGLLNHAVVDLIEEVQPHLIVSSSTKTSDLESFVLGNNTIGLIKNLGKTPMLIVPKNPLSSVIKKIVVAIDLSKPLSEKTLDHISALKEQLNATVEFVHVIEDTEDNGDNVVDSLSASGKHFYEHYQDCLTFITTNGSISASLSRFLNQKDADLLVMLYHRNNLLYKLTHEPAVRRMVYAHEKPVYIIPEELD